MGKLRGGEAAPVQQLQQQQQQQPPSQPAQPSQQQQQEQQAYVQRPDHHTSTVVC
jgi:hypothetical protein